MPIVATLTFVKTKQTERQKQEKLTEKLRTFLILDLDLQENEVDWSKN